jgi:hypothetical protein
MKFQLHRVGEGVVVERKTMDDLWAYVRENGFCEDALDDDELPPRRVLNQKYEIHTITSRGELIAMSKMRLTEVSTATEWEGPWPDI